MVVMLTLFIHQGVKIENNPTILTDKIDNKEFKIVISRLEKAFGRNPRRWHQVAANIRGVSEETTTGVHRLYQMQAAGEL